MRSTTYRRLQLFGGVLALVVAGIHLYWALPTLADQLRFGIINDPRPISFVFASLVIFMGILLVVQGVDPRSFYLAGIGLMIVFIVGYAAWHTVLSHGAFWPSRTTHTHSGPFFEIVAFHLRNDSLAFASKLTELILAIVLTVLYLMHDPVELES